MTLITAEGIYRDGTVKLLETLDQAPEGRVLVTFLGSDISLPQSHQQMQFGQFAGPQMSTEEDFKIAEWHDEAGQDAD